MALAIFNNVILDIKFPSVVYKKLLDYELNLEDLKDLDEETYKNFHFLLNSEDPNLEENLGVNFTTIVNKFGEQKLILLKVRFN